MTEVLYHDSIGAIKTVGKHDLINLSVWFVRVREGASETVSQFSHELRHSEVQRCW